MERRGENGTGSEDRGKNTTTPMGRGKRREGRERRGRVGRMGSGGIYLLCLGSIRDGSQREGEAT